MKTNIISIEKIKPIEIIIENHEPIDPDSELRLNLNQKLEKQEKGFKYQLTASVFKEAENDMEEKTFFIKYSLESHFICDNEELSTEDLCKEALDIMYPYIRAGISSAMGAIGIQPIVLPPHIVG